MFGIQSFTPAEVQKLQNETPSTKTIDPLQADEGAAAPLDEEAVGGAPVLGLHAGSWQLSADFSHVFWQHFGYMLNILSGQIPFDWILQINCSLAVSA